VGGLGAWWKFSGSLDDSSLSVRILGKVVQGDKPKEC
jgi:hypothetical protein